MGNGVGNPAKVDEDEDETSDDDDDLDAPVVRRSKASATRQPSAKSNLKPAATKPPPKSPSFSNIAPPATNGHTTSRPPTTSSKPKPIIPKPLPTSSKNPSKTPTPPSETLKSPDYKIYFRPANAQTDAIRRRMQARQEKERAEEIKKKKKAIEMDEIPIFLI